jgi:RNA polymerase sigma-70 factor, ECF subfamily
LNEADLRTSGEVLAAAQTGEQGAFATLVRMHERMVFSLALRMLAQRDAAEDLAQEVFLQLHLKLATLTSPEHARYWLRRTATHRAIDRIRRREPYETAPLEEAEGIATASEDDPMLARELRRQLLDLAPAARAVVLLRYQEDLDPTDIARTLDMSINTVKSHLKRSIAVLREGLREVADAQVAGGTQ